jgi:hypothetical protein
MRIDKTPPVISAPTITGTLGANGWYTSGVTLNWSTNDPESGILTPACATTVNGDTTGNTLTCSATNGAGLSSSSSVTIKIDNKEVENYLYTAREADAPQTIVEQVIEVNNARKKRMAHLQS